MVNDKNILDINDIKMTKEMKYIKWPKKKKVICEMFSVLIGTIVITMLIALGDEIGIFILNKILSII